MQGGKVYIPTPPSWPQVQHSSFWIPRSASNSCTLTCQSLLIEAHTRSAFSGVLLVASLAECGSLSTDSQPSLKHLCHTFICAALVALSLKAASIIWRVSTEECSSLKQNLMQIHLLYSVILNVTATQYSCSLNGVYHPHWRVQWSRHCSHMHIPVHFSWLPGYINIAQAVLIILATAGLFLDSPCINFHIP